jgi:hypothetical protein
MTGSDLNERDTSLFSHDIARTVHAERQREIERHLRAASDARTRSRAPRPSVRRRLGYGLIKIGSKLASDGPFQLAGRR